MKRRWLRAALWASFSNRESGAGGDASVADQHGKVSQKLSARARYATVTLRRSMRRHIGGAAGSCGKGEGLTAVRGEVDRAVPGCWHRGRPRAFPRSPCAGAASAGCRAHRTRDRTPLRRQSAPPRAVDGTAPGRARESARHQSRADAEDRPRLARRPADPDRGPPRRHAGAVLGTLAGGDRGAGRPRHAGPHHHHPRSRSRNVRHAVERDEAARTAWQADAQAWNPADLGFGAETGTQTDMTPRTGRAPRGQRAAETLPRNRGRHPSLVAALGVTGIPSGAGDRRSDGPTSPSRSSCARCWSPPYAPASR